MIQLALRLAKIVYLLITPARVCHRRGGVRDRVNLHDLHNYHLQEPIKVPDTFGFFLVSKNKMADRHRNRQL